MSVLINGMDMPESCRECPLNHDGMSCSVTGSYWWSDRIVLIDFDEHEERLPDCPLVKLPEKHGRLIDADYVVEKIRHKLGIKDISFLYNAEKSVVNQIFHAPTILEAEGVDECRQ